MSKNTHSKLLGGRLSLFPFTIRPVVSVVNNAFSIIPTGTSLRKFRSGSPFGRVVRYVFEHKHINKLLGSNLALAVLATSALQIPTSAQKSTVEITPQTVITANTLAFATEKGVRYPVDYIKINQKYSVYHPGLDLEGTTGDPVKPVMSGKVQSTQYSRFAYGNAVIVNHGNGITSLYAHLSKIYVKPGDEVAGNTIIGAVGSTGRSTGDHLHLEIRENGRAINPLTLLPR